MAHMADMNAILEASAQEKRQVNPHCDLQRGSAIEESQGAVGLPENDAERLPKSGLIGRG